MLQFSTDFETIFKAQYARLCKIVLPIVGNADTAEDIVQEVFMKIWQKKESLQVDISPEAYLKRAVVNAAIDHFRKEKRQPTASMETLATELGESLSAQSSEKELLTQELDTKIQAAINTLPPQCRAVFVLNRFEQLSYKEVAEQMQISVKTVENQIGKALKVLRLHLADYLCLLWFVIEIFKNQSF
ncbi:RNA polymerase sigma-70 factor [Hugenholtzia roseola]|uniref:RNA polymerase sigma-70 factor n=1 Tax=Hugenholtzia roseola TaxID=1002 RepID=UPI00054D5FF3|nr:RNA polymerase sigma-70 factor [Hugenholtzia roseola]